MSQKNKAKRKKKYGILRIFIILLVMVGVIGGVLIKTVFREQLTNVTMPNTEANRLISYLGLSEYEYTDKLGSSFTYSAARDLLDAASVPYDKTEVALEHMPGFMPLTRKQFESIYGTLIQELEINRLQSVSLYIYDIDHANDRNIDGISYELVKTSGGEYYIEKDYALDSGYIGKLVRLYISNNEIILCLGESNETITIRNAYVAKITEENGEEQLLCYIDGIMQRFLLDVNSKEMAENENSLCDIMLTKKGVTGITNHTKDLVTAKVTAYENGSVTVEGYEQPLYLSDAFNVYKIKGTLKAMQSAGTLIGYDNVSLYIADGVLEAALIAEDIHEKNIRVVLNNSDYTGLYHDVVTITSDTDFTVSYQDVVKEYKAGDRLEMRTGSEELQNGSAKIISKEEDGRIEIASIKRQGGTASYRGTIELSKSDKGIVIVNEISVEEYLYGVVPSEMPVSYEKEALKAQAICARAYAYRQMESENYTQYGAHLDDSIACQVYNNVEEDERAVYAVDDTYGVVPCYNDEVIESFFFSTSCGTTSNNSAVWGGNPEPYLLDTMETELNDMSNLSNEESFRKFMDGELGTGFIEADEPFFRWDVEYTKKQLDDTINNHLYERIVAMPDNILVLDAAGNYSQKDIKTVGDVVKVEVTKRGDSGIIEEMVITGTEEKILVKGQTNARALLSPEQVEIRKQDGTKLSGWTTLPSAYFYIEEAGENFVIHGGGFGHGVGMSQNGANNMAKMGYMAREIIEHYYTAVELKDMYKMLEK